MFVRLLTPVVLFASFVLGGLAGAQSAPKLEAFTADNSIRASATGHSASLRIGEAVGNWTLMQVMKSEGYVVFEDFAHMNGRIAFVGADGTRAEFPKASESTADDPAKLYLGKTEKEVMGSPTDLLGNAILAKPGDPKYEDIAGLLPAIRIMTTHGFVGTHDNPDKIGFEYGGRTPDFDPAAYFLAVTEIRQKGRVRNGLVGGYLPILRFVYPESEGTWDEMLAFAPLRVSDGNDRIQPAWYRIARIEKNELKSVRYIDSYHPFPPRTDYDSSLFYVDMVKLKSGWDRALQGSMQIEVPDKRVENMTRFSLIAEMMTRIGDFPKYGVLDRNYGGSEHDGFPDTFNVDTTAMLEWGLPELAGRYIDNYFGKFVRDDGSLLYRGPETGQYGRMLTVLAQYANNGGDSELLLRNRKHIDGVVKLLLHLREQAKALPASSPAYGMISGWSEADACLDPDPPRYMQPYFSNSAEAARGFRDLGRVWERIGSGKHDEELMRWGKSLQQESEGLQRDLQTAISRSLLKVNDETILPSIAGVKEPFHIAVPRDKTDPQFRSYRAYMEMLHSGMLSEEQVSLVTAYRARHYDTILGLPTAYGYNTGEVAGFLSYGNGYGLIQYDRIREALLLYYSDIAHQYTRGTWIAPETRNIALDKSAAPYCTPAELVVALMTKWLLVFEDPQSDTLWLGKGVPREWMTDGQTVQVRGAPTRWGRVSYTLRPSLREGRVEAQIELAPGFSGTLKLRLRVPDQKPIRSATVNSAPTPFDAATETITVPASAKQSIKVVANY